jgi:hypothetical protein
MSLELQIQQAIVNSGHTLWREQAKNRWIRINDLYGGWHEISHEDYTSQKTAKRETEKTGGQSFHKENHEGKHDDE